MAQDKIHSVAATDRLKGDYTPGMVREQAVDAIDGTRVPLTVDTICVHGDTPGAAELAARIRAELSQAGVTIKPIGEP